MAVSGISSSSLSTPSIQSSNQQNPRQLFMRMASAIQSGNVDAAQQAYSALMQQIGGTPSDPSNPFTQALKQIGQDLQSGDILGAQQTLQSLQQQTQGAHHAHHHHHHGSPPPPDLTPTATTDSSDPNSSAINILV